MNTTELKEMIEAIVKKEGAYSAHENSYGLSDKQGFMLRKQLKIVDTSDHYKYHVDKNYLICVPSKEGFVQSPASRAKHQLKVIYADYELWIDGEKIREGTTLEEAYTKLKDSFQDISPVIIAKVSDSYYSVEEDIKEAVSSWESSQG